MATDYLGPMNKLNIVIAGPGAVGQVIGGRLALAGHDVTFLGREGSREIEDINREGVRVNDLEDPGRSFVAKAKAVASLDGARPADLVLLTTKTYSTDETLPKLGPVVSEATILMSLQNGVEGVAEMPEFFRRGIILGAVCFMGATVSPAGVVELDSPEKLIVGDLDGQGGRALEIVLESFQRAGIAAVRSEDTRRLWAQLETRSRIAVPIESTRWSETIFSGTHQGTREAQQDAVLVRHTGETTIAALSDGHGSLGADVSGMAVQTFVASLESSEETLAETALAAAVRSTDQKILDWLDEEIRHRSNPVFLDSGATLLALLRRGSDIWIAHVGDSRAYHVSKKKGTARYLTQDHRWAGGESGALVSCLAMSRALGHHWDKQNGTLQATPDIIKVDGFENGDLIVLSSDGLTVSSGELAEIVLSHDPHQAHRKLIEMSLRNAKDDLDYLWARRKDPDYEHTIDNTTVILIAF